MMAVCAGCDKPIFDRYVHQVIDKPWHAACVICEDCKLPLKERCFSREGRLYCRSDFLKRYGPKCAGCQRIIQKEDLVRHAGEKIFHVGCFRCTTCQKQLDTGEELYIINRCKYICKNDYLNARQAFGPGTNCLSDCGSDDAEEDDLLTEEGSQSKGNDDRTNDPSSHLSRSTDHSPSSRESLSPSLQQHKHSSSGGADENSGCAITGSVQQQGGTKRRGPRTTIKAKQLETLKAAFNATPKPTRHIREQLAQETGLNMRVIQVWFQNRRSKERRMKQLHRYGTFRPGSRRSRNALLRDDPTALMVGPPGMFPDGLRRHGDPYYAPSGYPYCEMFSIGRDPTGSPSSMTLCPPAGSFMIPHPDETVVSMEHGQDGPFLMDDSMRRVSPDNHGGPAGAGEDQFRAHHGFASAMIPANEAGMAGW